MSSPSNSSNNSPTEPSALNWEWWSKRLAWQNRVEEEAIRKALDLPEEMGDINAPKSTTIQNGLGFKELAGLGALATGGWWLMQQSPPEPTPPPAAPPQVEPTETTHTERVELTFWQQLPDGTYEQVTIPQLMQRPDEQSPNDNGP